MILNNNDIKNKVFTGDSKEVLKTFPSNSVDLVVTSPPYFNLRNYQHKDQIGSEQSPKEYITNLISIFRECKRVLKRTGSIWVNIADSYNSKIGELRNPGFSEKNNYKRLEHANNVTNGINKNRIINNIPTKSLIGIPERFVIAMQDELGLIRRNTIIWHKPSCMPSSAKDRFTIDFEYFYFFVKDAKNYYFETQYEPMKMESLLREGRGRSPDAKYIKDCFNNQGIHYPRININKLEYNGTAQKDYKGNGVQDPSATKKRILESLKKRKFGGNKYPSNQDSVTNRTYSGNEWIPNENLERIKRTVWSINTPNSSEAHFATYPEELIEIPIKACTDQDKYNLVLDPFLGSGTTAIKAQKLGRSYVGIELNPKYVSIAKKRLMYMISSYIPRE